MRPIRRPMRWREECAAGRLLVLWGSS